LAGRNTVPYLCGMTSAADLKFLLQGGKLVQETSNRKAALAP
jgi:hypothetical protein